VIEASQALPAAKDLRIFMEKTALLLNSDGSIYHLNLHPEELAEMVIFVGDPDRVSSVSQHFDRIDIKKQKREFITHTGELNGQRLSVISTGIGTDNIDIVLNECDALHNVDFKKHQVKDNIKSLRFLRLGTCGSITETVDVDELICSTAAIGFDDLMNFYQYQPSPTEVALLSAVKKHFHTLPAATNAYVAEADPTFIKQFEKFCHPGVTLTCSGFYGPQYRTLRAPLIKNNVLEIAASFTSSQGVICNVEMETAGIYALAKLLGHQACSVAVVLDNTVKQTVSKNMHAAVNSMIETLLGTLLV